LKVLIHQTVKRQQQQQLFKSLQFDEKTSFQKLFEFGVYQRDEEMGMLKR
jgi:hypothetical protein